MITVRLYAILEKEERVLSLIKKQEEVEQQKRQNLLEFQQKFRNYSRLGWFSGVAFLVALLTGLWIGINQVPDGVICYENNFFCTKLRVKTPKKVI